ncbi:hypothetical protein SELMODRAFT_419186 [Selaginella moellendorffii]|uniref:NADH kinase n=1 Tax=Selaginella moellendorffii TaxID=88036 RepID=D8S845_SELML|nr:probable NADH kinase isoform X1 [Selaginella moellendorffii]EFJ19356.1 hypothetical protein SELMODRAFT_419186 [Selaginella moellendorffii]|eukprot:XP_002979467.1 probable NADH kinase isoform X1 [Selaginella moellendorffii]
MRRVLVLLKRSAYDLYVARHRDPAFVNGSAEKTKVVENLLDRHRVHESTVQKCKDVLANMSLSWDLLLRDELHSPIRNVDLVVTVGGDGTLLQASHYLDDSIPVLGVNSDPTKTDEVQEQQMEEFDATRSRGYFCAATSEDFEQVLGKVISGKLQPKTLRRISTTIDGTLFSTPALNDVLLAHPNPAAVSRCTFSVVNQQTKSGSLIHSRSSGLRVCTAAGSTAATLSAGGFAMPLESKELQYMLREPILPHPKQKNLMHGFVGSTEAIQVTWGCRQGSIYFDGAHVSAPIKFGTVVTISASGPPVKVFLEQ